MSARVLVLMGVSGSGKTTIGEALSRKLGWPLYDGDDFHPPENVKKMSRGEPLSDEDRAPWLDRLRELIDSHLAEGRDAIVGCSALKEAYRRRLGVNDPRVELVYLKGSYDLILRRMQDRNDHFFRPKMLQSQFADLEEPEGAWVVDVDEDPDGIVDEIIQILKTESRPNPR